MWAYIVDTYNSLEPIIKVVYIYGTPCIYDGHEELIERVSCEGGSGGW